MEQFSDREQTSATWWWRGRHVTGIFAGLETGVYGPSKILLLSSINNSSGNNNIIGVLQTVFHDDCQKSRFAADISFGRPKPRV